MILKVIGVFQVVLIQVISAQLFGLDLSSQNVLNNLENLPLAGYGRFKRQINNPPVGLPNNGNLPVNGIANGLPLRNGMPFGNFGRGNGLSNSLAFSNGLPNNFGLNNGMALPNTPQLNVPFGSVNNVPQNRILPSINGINNNGLPFNNIPKGLPNINNLPVANKFPYLNNVPVSNNILNVNNWPAANSLPNINNLPAANSMPNINNLPTANLLQNINNLPNPNSLPSFNSQPCGHALPQLPQTNGLPLNKLPNGNMLSPINNRLPTINNFRITEIGIGNGAAENIRFPRNNLPDNNMLSNVNNVQNYNGLAQVLDGLANINNNGFSGITNTPVNAFTNYMPADSRFSNIDHFLYPNGVTNFGNEAQNTNNMQISGVSDVNNFQNNNLMPVNQQRLVNNLPYYDSFPGLNNFPANAGMPTNRLVNALNIGMLIPNEGYFNDAMLANNGMVVNTPESYLQNGHEFFNNDFQFGNMHVPVSNWQHDFVGANVPMNQNLPEGVQMFSNVPNDYLALSTNHFNLAQELVKNLQIEGVGNMPFLNGLPVAGITETVTVLNSPCNK